MGRVLWESIVGTETIKYFDKYDEARKYLETAQSFIWTILANKEIPLMRGLDIVIETAEDAQKRAAGIIKISPYKSGPRLEYMQSKERAFKRLERILRSARTKERERRERRRKR